MGRSESGWTGSRNLDEFVSRLLQLAVCCCTGRDRRPAAAAARERKRERERDRASLYLLTPDHPRRRRLLVVVVVVVVVVAVVVVVVSGGALSLQRVKGGADSFLLAVSKWKGVRGVGCRFCLRDSLGLAFLFVSCFRLVLHLV